MKISYADYHDLINDCSEQIQKYVIEKNQINDIYFRAKILIREINKISYKNLSFREKSIEWLNKKDTIKLKNVLSFTSYNDSKLIDYNCFDLIDTVYNSAD